MLPSTELLTFIVRKKSQYYCHKRTCSEEHHKRQHFRWFEIQRWMHRRFRCVYHYHLKRQNISMPRLAKTEQRNTRAVSEEILAGTEIPGGGGRGRLYLKPVLNWANVCSPNILRTLRRTMISFLNWTFSSPNMVRTVQTLLRSQLACNEMQASAWTCGRQHDRKCRLKSSQVNIL